MDQITQGTPTPLPQQPSAQIPQATPTQPSASAQPISAQPVNVAPAPPSKLKNPKLWIGAGVALLIVIVVSAFFLGKPPLFTGKVPSGTPPAAERPAADNCANLSQAKCQDPGLSGICEWVTLAGGEKAVCKAVSAPAPVIEQEKPPEPAPSSPREDLEKIRNDALAEAERLASEANAAATEAERHAQATNTEEARRAASHAETAAEAARVAAQTIKNAQTEEEIQMALANVQEAHNRALSNRDVAAALANAAAAQAAEDAARAEAEGARAREFEQRCGQEKANYNPDNRLCTLADGTVASNIAELDTALARISAAAAEQEKNRQDCEARISFEWTGAECRKKEEKEKKKNKGKKDEVVKIEEVKCPTDKPISFEGQCFEQNQLCATLGADITNSLKDGKTKPEDVAGAVAELNSISECHFQAGQFLTDLDEEKARDECKARDQNVWEWDQSAKICKNKQEARISDLESLIGSLQGQLVNAQNANNNAQINALNEQIADLITEMNNLRQAAGQPVVVNVIAPPAPTPAPTPAPASGGGDAEIVAVNVKETQKKKEKKTASTATAESASASALAVSDNNAVAAKPSAAASASDASASSAQGTHGVFIQGRTGPGVLLYPVLVAAANSIYFWLRKKKRTK